MRCTANRATSAVFRRLKTITCNRIGGFEPGGRGFRVPPPRQIRMTNQLVTDYALTAFCLSTTSAEVMPDFVSQTFTRRADQFLQLRRRVMGRDISIAVPQ